MLMLLAAAGLAACQPAGPKASPAQIAAHAAAMTPADPRLADLYAHACKACHAQLGTGAPQAGDHDAWGPRARKGMPAGGQCFACTGADYQALVRFMADQPDN